ncbi:MAG: DNA (cytosine-5-)-methyltransferase [Minisyncoccota bacterium]
MKKLRVAELFAGVGGFRVGLERAASGTFETVWFNQWEPGKSDTSQHAWNVYCKAFGLDPLAARLACTNLDIAKVAVKDIPDHDLLVGGFPCQDYSVARTLNQAMGLKGKKGVLWWDIYRIVREKGRKAPKFLMLENVDRLLKSPVSQRGRDFAIMLASLAEQGYAVEWRVINAADYGMPQRRRRTYILGYRKGTSQYSALKSDPIKWLFEDGVTPTAFPIANHGPVDTISLPDAQDVSNDFKTAAGGKTPFENAGVMIGGNVYTSRIEPLHKGKRTLLKHIILKEGKVDDEFFILEERLGSWEQLKGGKKERRKSKSGFEYDYSEGPVAFPDHLDKPSRTIVTGEGGSGPSRFKHVIRTESGRYRRLMPIELERLNMFPDNHTAVASDNQRAFFMGNALVVGIVERLGKELASRIDD